MRSHFRFRDYIVKMGLDYSLNEERDVYTVYTWVKRGMDYYPVAIVEVSGLDVRNDYGKIKERIEMAVALQEIMEG